MSGHTERNTDQGKSDAGKWKRKTLVQFRSTGAAFPFVGALQLIDQLRDRQGRATWSFFLLLVKLIKADWQCSLRHINAVMNLAEIVGTLFVPLLVTCLIQVHEDSLISQIGLQHSGTGKGHPNGQRRVIHLKDGNVLQSVSFLLADVDFPSRKFIDDLVATEKRHRITGC